MANQMHSLLGACFWLHSYASSLPREDVLTIQGSIYYRKV
jgi:hypothetical protein